MLGNIVRILIPVLLFMACSKGDVSGGSSGSLVQDFDDSDNIGNEYEYDSNQFLSFQWDGYSLVSSLYEDINKGDILKTVESRHSWGKDNAGIVAIWYQNNEYVYNLPMVTSGQIMSEWQAVEVAKGKYDFSVIEKKLKNFHEKKIRTTIQINGGKHPLWMFEEIPYVKNAKLSSGVSDTKGTLMYWYPTYVEAYERLIQELGALISASAYKSCILGIRFNLNALGTEQTVPPQNFQSGSGTINAQKAASYYYPENADRALAKDWSEQTLKEYSTRIYSAYTSSFPDTRIFLRNDVDESVMILASSGLASGDIGVFHTSSEPEPRGSGGEAKMSVFNNYCRSATTVGYAEEWADCWGIHGNKTDPHFCSPSQWLYWRILSDLNVGVPYVCLYGSILSFVMGAEPPVAMEDEDNAREEMRKALEFLYRYVGHNYNPSTAPGAFVAFRKSDENSSIAENKDYYTQYTSRLSKYTGDYSFLCISKDNSAKGRKLVGDNTTRYGAFAREIGYNDKVRIVLHPEFAKAIYNKPLKLKVIYFDSGSAEWQVRYGDDVFTVNNGGTNQWKEIEWDVVGAQRQNDLSASRVVEAGFEASSGELNQLKEDLEIQANKGTLTLHMVELKRY